MLSSNVLHLGPKMFKTIKSKNFWLAWISQLTSVPFKWIDIRWAHLHMPTIESIRVNWALHPNFGYCSCFFACVTEGWGYLKQVPVTHQNRQTDGFQISSRSTCTRASWMRNFTMQSFWVCRCGHPTTGLMFIANEGFPTSKTDLFGGELGRIPDKKDINMRIYIYTLCM